MPAMATLSRAEYLWGCLALTERRRILIRKRKTKHRILASFFENMGYARNKRRFLVGTCHGIMAIKCAPS
jgi:hypothetical protein